LANALAMVTRCCYPPDNWFGKCVNLCYIPTDFKSYLARVDISELDKSPFKIMGNYTFCIAVREEIKLKV
jgi:hypothetical protein